MTRSRRPLRTAAYIVGGLLVVSVAAFVWLLSVASNGWTEHAAKAMDEARARGAHRPVLRGEAVPGSAWAEYEHGLAALKGLDVTSVRRWLDGAAADETKAREILAANGKALDFLRAGARKAEGVYPTQWEKGFAADTPSLLSVRNLTTLAVGQARVLREAGQVREAADLLIDAAQLGADLGRNTTLITEMIALSSLSDVFDGLRTLPADPEVGTALAVLDATFPDHAHAMLNELALMGVGLTQISRGFGISATWRFGFSGQLLAADAWSGLEDHMRRMAATTTMPWKEARHAAAGVEAEGKKSTNQIVQTVIPGLARSLSVSRESRAQLRLLRWLHGGATGLADPFGDTLRSNGVKVWSLGADGVDGGGVGAWKPAPTGDIVLELPPK